MSKYKLFIFLLFTYFIVICLQKLWNIPVVIAILKIIWTLICALFVTLILYPFIEKLPKKWNWKTKVFVIYGLVFSGIISFMLLMIPLLIQQFLEIYHRYPHYFNRSLHILSEKMEEMMSLSDISMHEFQNIKVYLESLIGLLSTFADYCFVYLLSLFIALDLKFFQALIQFVKAKNGFVYLVYERFSKMIFQYMKGTFLDIVVLGSGAYLIMSYFEMNGALLYAMILAFANLIPYIGSIVALLLITVMAILYKGIRIWPMLLGLWIFQQIEANLLQTYIFHRVMHVRPLFTLIAFFITQTLLGFWWILLSPILAGFLEMLVQSWIEMFKDDKQKEEQNIICNTQDVAT